MQDILFAETKDQMVSYCAVCVASPTQSHTDWTLGLGEAK